MFKSLYSTKRENLFAAPFVVFAILVIGTGVYSLVGSPLQSWTLALTVIVGVLISGPFRVYLGRDRGLPLVGVGVTMLAISPTPDTPQLGVCLWAAGILISQLILRRNLLHATYIAGLGSLAAFVFVTVHSLLTGVGIWLLPSFLIAAAAYYLLFLLGELARQRNQTDEGPGFSITSLSPARIGLLVLAVGSAATLMNLLNTYIIPWLERDPEIRRAPFVVLLTALAFYLLAQRSRNAAIERRLRAVVDAAVELPREASDGLADALRNRAQSIVQADAVELRRHAPEPHEIGAEITLEAGVDQYLVASRTLGGAPFAREDARALATLAHMASEAARIQYEVNSLERRANTDPLTGLPNYGAFQRALVDANENREYHEGIALLFIDLDNFKTLNDNHGHPAGDEMLRQVATRLQSAAGGGDFVSRVGGDEFVVIFTGLVSAEQAKESAERIIAAVSEPLEIEGHDMRPVVSAGLAFSSHRELDAQTLVADADRTMLHVKRTRRQDGPAESSSVGLSEHRSTRTNDIVARAIRMNRLNLAFQPIVSIDEGKIWAFEALVRYVDPELGPISPPSLVARAKSLGLMNELTKQVITKALHAATEFRRLEPSITCMTVNLELGQISDAELGPFIRESARAHPDITLCVELNERSLRTITEELRRDALALQAAGVTLALDDYGSDDSSVGALVHFPMNILKIDKSLISNLDDQRQREVIKSLQGFGDNLDYTVVVEGIETTAMAGVLHGLGVRSAQGYHYGRPISLPLTLERLRRHGTVACITT